MGLREVNTKGIQQTNIAMQLSTEAYPLKKHLKFRENQMESEVGSTALLKLLKTALQKLINFSLPQPNFTPHQPI